MGWKYDCPVCDSIVETDWNEDDVEDLIVGNLIRCQVCLHILEVENVDQVSDFEMKLIKSKDKRRAESKLNEPDVISVIDI